MSQILCGTQTVNTDISSESALLRQSSPTVNVTSASTAGAFASWRDIGVRLIKGMAVNAMRLVDIMTNGRTGMPPCGIQTTTNTAYPPGLTIAANRIAVLIKTMTVLAVSFHCSCHGSIARTSREVLSPFGNHVGDIICLAAEKEVFGIAARRIITLVQHSSPIGNWPISQLPSNAMSKSRSMPTARYKSGTYTKCSIPAMRLAMRLPQPAFIIGATLHLTPEPFRDIFHLGIRYLLSTSQRVHYNVLPQVFKPYCITLSAGGQA